MTATCHYARPRSVEEAIESLEASGGEGTVIAGGVALGILMNERLVRPTWLVDITRIERLRELDLTANGELRIGATLPNTELERSATVARDFPLLHEMSHEIACGRVRNRGTVGGNICLADPQGDPPAAMLALDATLNVRGPNGARTVPISEFFHDLYTTALGESDILEEIVVPPIPANAGYAYGKYGARRAMDYTATISAAVTMVRDNGGVSDIRIGMGGVGTTPVRPYGAEAALRGRTPDAEVLAAMAAALAEELTPLADLIYSADYKRHVASVILRRTVERAYRRAGGQAV